MIRRSTRWSAWAILALILVEIAGAAFLAAYGGVGLGSVATAIATVVFVVTTAIVGTLIGLRSPGHRIGWLLRIAAFVFATGALIESYVEFVYFVRPGSLPVGPVVVLLGDWVFVLGFGISATFLLLLFPTGRLPSPRWRTVAWIAAIGMAWSSVGILLGPGAVEGLPIETRTPWGARASCSSSSKGAGSTFSWQRSWPRWPHWWSGIAGRSEKSDSNSSRWPLVSWRSAWGWRGPFSGRLANGSAELSDDTENLSIALSLTMVPISIGIAILRYRLYDIDRIISRTLSYGVLTVPGGGIRGAGVRASRAPPV